MASQPGQQIITMHLLSNISRSKGTQAMKFGWFIKYNGRNIFENSCKKRAWKTSSRPFCFLKNLLIR